MNHVFTLFAFALMSSGLAQLPDYVPSDGLVAWYPLDGLAHDAGTYELDGVLEGPAAAEDRYGNSNGALSFDGLDDRVSIPHSDLTNPSVLTLSVWFKDSDFSNSDGQQSQLISKREFTGWGNAYEFGIGYPITEFPGTPTIYSNFSVNGNHTIFHASDSIFENQWHQAVYCHGEDSLFLYLDGERVLAQISPGPLPTSNELPTWFGGRPGGSGRNFFSGLLDDIGIWNRVLSHEEILALYISEQPISGCTDTAACNYEPTALEDDDSCDFSCCPGPGCCDVGMHWDWELGMCQITNVADTNLDGCVQLNDLLDILSAYGGCDADQSVWQCGNLLEYQGYDYETVLIEEQCWFAENLRSENYENGDAIPSNLGDSDWYATTSGATAVYEESASNLEMYGRLYNWFAVDDFRGLCPNGWHVPSDEEWMTMEIALGMSEAEANTTGYRGTDQGTQMKSEYGWGNGGNGTNSSGFSALAGGYRFDNGGYAYQGSQEGWWSSTPYESYAWHRFLFEGYQNVERETYHLGSGFAIRCIQNTE